MSKTGKFFLVLNLLMGIGAIYVIGGYVSMRNAWQQRVEKAQSAYVKKRESIDTTKQAYNEAAETMTRKRLAWGRSNGWEKVGVTITDPNRGLIQAAIGTNKGLTLPVSVDGGATPATKPILYAFQPTADGGYEYVGEFQATTIDANRSAFELTRAVRPGEGQTWKPGGWRFRDRVPSGQLARFTELEVQIDQATELLKERQVNIKTQDNLLKVAKEQLQDRLKELNGNPESPDLLGEVTKKGLVESIRLNDQKRNENLNELNRLRLKLKSLHDQFLKLKQDNVELANEIIKKSADSSKTAASEDDASTR